MPVPDTSTVAFEAPGLLNVNVSTIGPAIVGENRTNTFVFTLPFVCGNDNVELKGPLAEALTSKAGLDDVTVMGPVRLEPLTATD
jgi:hypothetical protein